MKLLAVPREPLGSAFTMLVLSTLHHATNISAVTTPGVPAASEHLHLSSATGTTLALEIPIMFTATQENQRPVSSVNPRQRVVTLSVS